MFCLLLPLFLPLKQFDFNNIFSSKCLILSILYYIWFNHNQKNKNTICFYFFISSICLHMYIPIYITIYETYHKFDFPKVWCSFGKLDLFCVCFDSFCENKVDIL